jgi:hypothetical protein
MPYLKWLSITKDFYEFLAISDYCYSFVLSKVLLAIFETIGVKLPFVVTQTVDIVFLKIFKKFTTSTI